MPIDPTRDEWLEAYRRLQRLEQDFLEANPHETIGGPSDVAVAEAALGCPCPPHRAPVGWRSGDGGIGTLLVTTHADGGVWVGFPHVKHQALTADEADKAAAALTEHARYAREQGDDQCLPPPPDGCRR
jgi:hypothetical protein